MILIIWGYYKLNNIKQENNINGEFYRFIIIFQRIKINMFRKTIMYNI